MENHIYTAASLVVPRATIRCAVVRCACYMGADHLPCRDSLKELVTAQAANAQAEEPIAAGTTTPPGGTSSSQAFSAAFTDPEAHVNGTIAQELRDRDLLGAERCALAAVWPRRSSRDVVCYRADVAAVSSWVEDELVTRGFRVFGSPK